MNTLTRRTKSTSGKMVRPKNIKEAWMAVVAAADFNMYLFMVQ